MNWCDAALRPQGGVWRCAVTALEYVTGVNRDDIVKDLGHDGGSRPASVAARFGNGTSTCDDAFAFVGILDAEIQWWAARRNVPYFVLHSREHLSRVCQQSMDSDTMHPLVSVPTSSEVMGFIQGKCAVITVPMSDTPNRHHLVAWLGAFAIDPMHGIRRQLDSNDVLGAMVFPLIDQGTRIRALYGDSVGPDSEALGGEMS